MASKPQFGIDAPSLVLAFTLGGPVLIALSFLPVLAPPLAWTLRGTGVVLMAEAILMTLSSLYGKPRLLRRLVATLQLEGNEQVLDVGCGRGMLLLEVARQLPRGQAIGIDLWSRRDQSGNSANATLTNARRGGVAEQVRVETGDMRRLPSADASFDAVVSSLAIHNLVAAADRDQSVREMVRVLKPGGRIALLDFRHSADYAATLRAAGLLDVTRHGPSFLMFPWVWSVTAHKAA